MLVALQELLVRNDTSACRGVWTQGLQFKGLGLIVPPAKTGQKPLITRIYQVVTDLLGLLAVILTRHVIHSETSAEMTYRLGFDLPMAACRRHHVAITVILTCHPRPCHQPGVIVIVNTIVVIVTIAIVINIMIITIIMDSSSITKAICSSLSTSQVMNRKHRWNNKAESKNNQAPRYFSECRSDQDE